MAEQYATHLRLHKDSNWYRILAFIGPDEKHAPSWLIAYTSYDVNGGDPVEQLEHGLPPIERVPVEYSNFRWIIHDQIEAMKIDHENDIIDIMVKEDGA